MGKAQRRRGVSFRRRSQSQWLTGGTEGPESKFETARPLAPFPAWRVIPTVPSLVDFEGESLLQESGHIFHLKLSRRPRTQSTVFMSQRQPMHPGPGVESY